jgi:hypothetical protein
MSLRIEKEGVVSTVPGDVHETHEQTVTRPCGNPTEAVRSDLIPPPNFRSAAVGTHKVDHLFVSDRPSPNIRDLARHPGSLADLSMVTQEDWIRPRVDAANDVSATAAVTASSAPVADRQTATSHLRGYALAGAFHLAHATPRQPPLAEETSPTARFVSVPCPGGLIINQPP